METSLQWDNLVTHPSLAAEIMMFKCWGAQLRSSESNNKHSYLQHENLPSRLVDIKLGLVRPVGINPLPCQEVHDVLRPVLVAVRGRHLEEKHF